MFLGLLLRLLELILTKYICIMSKSIFQTFKSSAPDFMQIGEIKRHIFSLVRIVLLDSFTNFDGSEKEELPEWEDAVPQLAIVAMSKTGKGGITHRFNGSGYIRYDELSKAQLKSGKYEDCNGYAVKDVNGHRVRTEDPAKTESCKNILNQFFSSLSMEEGSGIEDLDTAIENGNTFMADVVNEPYQGRDQFRLAKLRKSPLSAENDSEDDGEDWSEDE